MKLEIIKRAGKYAVREKRFGIWFYLELAGCERGCAHIIPDYYCWGSWEKAESLYQGLIAYDYFKSAEAEVVQGYEGL